MLSLNCAFAQYAYLLPLRLLIPWFYPLLCAAARRPPPFRPGSGAQVLVLSLSLSGIQRASGRERAVNYHNDFL